MNIAVRALLVLLALLSGSVPAAAVPHYQQVQICDATGACDGITATSKLPYAGTAGQNLAANSFAGVGGLDANGKFSPFLSSAFGVLCAEMCDPTGVTCATAGVLGSDNAGVAQGMFVNANTTLFNGVGWDRARTAGIGNNVAATGVAAHAVYGQFNTILPTITSGNYSALQTDASARLLVGSIAAALPAGTNTIGNVNQTTGTSGYSYLLDSGGTNKLSISPPGGALVRQGKTATILTSASATACTNIQNTAGTLVEIVNVGSATAVFPAFFNDAGATCATGTRVYGNGTSLTLQAGQAVALNIPLSAGLAYTLSGALSDNLVVVTQ